MSRVAVVTGAAGAIGSAVCARLSAAGDTVIGLDAAAGADAASSMVEAIVCDIADDESVAGAFDAIRSRHGHPTVLVNNAGVTGAGGVEDESPADWRRIIDVNLTGAYLCTRQVVAGMREARRGQDREHRLRERPIRRLGALGACVRGQQGRAGHPEPLPGLHHAADSITVNAVAPGPHDTPMWDALDPVWRERILATVPGDAPGNPADLAAMVEFLCGPHAGYITGATIDINGGQWMG